MFNRWSIFFPVVNGQLTCSCNASTLVSHQAKIPSTKMSIYFVNPGCILCCLMNKFVYKSFPPQETTRFILLSKLLVWGMCCLHRKWVHWRKDLMVFWFLVCSCSLMCCGWCNGVVITTLWCWVVLLAVVPHIVHCRLGELWHQRSSSSLSLLTEITDFEESAVAQNAQRSINYICNYYSDKFASFNWYGILTCPISSCWLSCWRSISVL